MEDTTPGTATLDDGLLGALRDGALLLTATRRLARVLAREYDLRQLASGLGVWPSATILPLRAWLETAWHTTWPTERLLTAPQVRSLWEQAIASDGPTHEAALLREDATATLAREANALTCEYELPEASRYETTAEHAAFLRWREQVRARCQSHGWLDPALLTAAVTRAFTAGLLPPPRRVVLAGFDEITPAATALLRALAELGSSITHWAPGAPAACRRARHHAPDPLAETRLVASWIRHAWRPGMRIGIVVPDLGARRSSIERILTAELTPAAVLAPAPPPVLDLSLGTPLADEPAIATALALLRALCGALPWEEVAFLLQSAHFGEAESEWRERARLEVRMRAAAILSPALERLASLADESGASGTARRLRALAALAVRAGKSRRPPSAWARLFDEALEAAGWPGERTLDSREAQALRAWHEALDTLAALDAQMPPLERGEACALLARLCTERIFQPESRDAPIQVLGLLEAAGLRFDLLWIMGLHEDALPSPPRPNPLLPVTLQRRFGVPHASAEHELAHARRLLERLWRSAAEVVVSAPRTLDGSPVRASPLVASLPEEPPGWSVGSRALAAAVHRSGTLELVADDVVIPVAPRETIRA